MLYLRKINPDIKAADIISHYVRMSKYNFSWYEWDGCTAAVDDSHSLHILIIKSETGIYMDTYDNFSPFPTPGRNVIRVFSAIIEDISRDRNTMFVTISYNDCVGCTGRGDTVRLVVNQDTDIYDERGRNIRPGELERGMTVDANFSSAMTRSIPPQSQAFFIRVIRRAAQTETTTGRIIEVNTRGSFILVLRNQNPASAIRFNISPDTVILDLFGRRTRLASLRPGFRVRVVHATFMTASIPPQTSAFSVQVIR